MRARCRHRPLGMGMGGARVGSKCKYREKQLVHWHYLVRDKGEIARLKHFSGVIFHERFGLYMEITEHFIGAPATD